MGEKVRFDGGHKQDAFLCETFGRFVEWIPVCPEIEVGMGVPRETVRLVGAPSDPKMIAERSGRDWTMAMKRFAAIRTNELADLKLSGYVFKKNSPSCGVERVRVYDTKNMPARRGRGLFAAAVMTSLPLLPVEEEGRLNDPGAAGKLYRKSVRLSSLAGSAGGAQNPPARSSSFTPAQISVAGAQRAPLPAAGPPGRGRQENFSARDV